MKSRNAMAVGGSLILKAGVCGNLAHLLFTIWVTVEQVQTGWGCGTGMEMIALVPWTVELLCIPALLAVAVFSFLHIKWKAPKGIMVANWTAYGLLVLQMGLFNLFVHY